jgi:hypothetical protein
LVTGDLLLLVENGGIVDAAAVRDKTTHWTPQRTGSCLVAETSHCRNSCAQNQSSSRAATFRAAQQE